MVDCGNVLRGFGTLTSVSTEIRVFWDKTTVAIGKYLPTFLSYLDPENGHNILIRYSGKS